MNKDKIIISKMRLMILIPLIFIVVTACSANENGALSQKDINFSTQPLGGAPMSHSDDVEVPDFIDVSGEDEIVTYRILNPNIDEHNQYDGLPIDEYVFTLTSISKDENIITYTYLDEEENTITEEFEIKSESVMKNINNNYFYEWWGSVGWTPTEEINHDN